MQFWSRHLILLLLCVVLPLGAALYADTQSEVARARGAATVALKAADNALQSVVLVQAHTILGSAQTLAQQVTDLDPEFELANPNPQALPKKKLAFGLLKPVLDDKAPVGGFVWILDAQGRLLAKNGQADLTESTDSVLGHPLFTETQRGYALDGLWRVDRQWFLVGAAPLVFKGVANGALWTAVPLDRALIDRLAQQIGAGVSLVEGEQLVASSLGDQGSFVLQIKDSEPVFDGSIALRHPYLPLLPLFADLEHLAYGAIARPAVGSQALRWVVSVPGGRGLEELAGRQEIVLGALVASLMLALLVGLVNYRTFVLPLEKIASHLSSIQMGKGELELSENEVPGPFRRLVRLLNMTAQKLPSRALAGMSMDLGPMPELRASQSSAGTLPPPAPQVPSVTLPPPPPPQVSQHSPITALPLQAPSRRDSLVMQAQSMGIDAVLQPQGPAASMSMPGAVLPPPPAPKLDSRPASKSEPRKSSSSRDDDEAAAIAEAIASLEKGLSPIAEPKSRDLGRSSPPERIASIQAAPTTVRGGGSLGIGIDLGSYAGLEEPEEVPEPAEGGFSPEATVVAPVAEDLLARSARDDLTDAVRAINEKSPDMTVVASVPADLLAQSASERTPLPRSRSALEAQLEPADRAHFEEVYERFIEMRKRCGETTGDLAYDRFLAKLTRNRETLVKKYNCRTVRFQVYEKDGKAALKATPVRAR